MSVTIPANQPHDVTLVDSVDIAEMADVTYERVRQWKSNASTFPEPFAVVGRSQVWTEADVRYWLDHERPTQQGPAPCGTRNGAVGHRRRGEPVCDECRAGEAADQRARNKDRHRRMMAGEVAPPHGSASTYNNYLCRCDACRAAHSVVMAKRYEARP